MGFLTNTILALFIFTCLFLILLVMIQTGKGGMGGVFGGGGSQSPFGSGTADILSTATKYAAITFMLLSLVLSYLFAKKQTILPETESIIQPVEQNDKTNTDTNQTEVPAAAPASN